MRSKSAKNGGNLESPGLSTVNQMILIKFQQDYVNGKRNILFQALKSPVLRFGYSKNVFRESKHVTTPCISSFRLKLG